MIVFLPSQEHVVLELLRPQISHFFVSYMKSVYNEPSFSTSQLLEFVTRWTKACLITSLLHILWPSFSQGEPALQWL